MNNAKAKFILRSYRSNGEDANDPAFREALEQAEHDPALNAWLREEQEMDDSIRSKLNDTPVPEDLLDDILATQSITVSRSFWRQGRTWMAMAALVMALFGGYFMISPHQPQPAVSFQTFPEMAAAFASHDFELDMEAANTHQAKEWAQSKLISRDIPVSDRLRQMGDNRGVGCKYFDWEGEDVLLLCFFLEDGSQVHYFVMDIQNLPDVPETGHELPQWAKYGEWTTASWADSERAYVVASKSDRENMVSLL